MDTPFPAYQGDEPYVFVCYAHEDSDIVYPEIAWLREQGTNLWYDEGIAAGKNWRGAIGEIPRNRMYRDPRWCGSAHADIDRLHR